MHNQITTIGEEKGDWLSDYLNIKKLLNVPAESFDVLRLYRTSTVLLTCWAPTPPVPGSRRSSGFTSGASRSGRNIRISAKSSSTIVTDARVIGMGNWLWRFRVNIIVCIYQSEAAQTSRTMKVNLNRDPETPGKGKVVCVCPFTHSVP